MNTCISCGKSVGHERKDWLFPVMTGNGIHWFCVECLRIEVRPET